MSAGRYKLEDRRSAFGTAFGCNQVEEADGDDEGWTDEGERPPMTAGAYAFQKPNAKSKVAAVFVGC